MVRKQMYLKRGKNKNSSCRLLLPADPPAKTVQADLRLFFLLFLNSSPPRPGTHRAHRRGSTGSLRPSGPVRTQVGGRSLSHPLPAGTSGSTGLLAALCAGAASSSSSAKGVASAQRACFRCVHAGVISAAFCVTLPPPPSLSPPLCHGSSQLRRGVCPDRLQAGARSRLRAFTTL